MLRAGLQPCWAWAWPHSTGSPQLWSRNWVDIKQATDDPGYNFENNWLFARQPNPALALHDAIVAPGFVDCGHP